MAMTAAQKKAFAERMAAARAAKGSRASAPRASTAIIVAPQAKSLGAPPKAAPKSLARRVSSAAVVAAVQEKELLATGITGAAIGYVEQEGWLKELPEPQSLPIGKTGSLAIFSYVVNRFFVKDPETKKILSGVTSASTAITGYHLGKGYALKAQAEKLIKGENAAGDDLDDDGKRAGI